MKIQPLALPSAKRGRAVFFQRSIARERAAYYKEVSQWQGDTSRCRLQNAQGKLDLLEIKCHCERHGQVSVARLIEEHGPDTGLPDL